MPDAKLVPDVRILNRQVGDHQVGNEQLLKHVCDDVARTDLLVCAERLQPGRLQRRTDVLVVHAIEIDWFTVRAGLATKRHRYERMRSRRHKMCTALKISG